MADERSGPDWEAHLAGVVTVADPSPANDQRASATSSRRKRGSSLSDLRSVQVNIKMTAKAKRQLFEVARRRGLSVPSLVEWLVEREAIEQSQR